MSRFDLSFTHIGSFLSIIIYDENKDFIEFTGILLAELFPFCSLLQFLLFLSREQHCILLLDITYYSSLLHCSHTNCKSSTMINFNFSILKFIIFQSNSTNFLISSLLTTYYVLSILMQISHILHMQNQSNKPLLHSSLTFESN